MPAKKKSKSQSKSKLDSKDFYRMLLRIYQEIAKTNTLYDALTTLVNFSTSAIECECGTIFLNDAATDELYSYAVKGNLQHEIRVLNNMGLVGWSFINNKTVIVTDAYADERFNPKIDMVTGYKTKSVLCVPLKGVGDKVIGVAEMLNKKEGHFTQLDIDLIKAMVQQAALSIQSKVVLEHIESKHKKELEFLESMAQVAAEIHLSKLLEKTILAVTKILDAERSTLFINDPMTNELYTEVGEGLGKTQIRFPNHLGIAGSVYTSEKVINIPYAYADLRFNPAFDKSTGFFTRSILAAPVKNKTGQVIGVTQVLNKKRGAFTVADETQLAAINTQIAMAIENAKLFDDVENMKNYNESMFESMSNGVITFNENNKIVTCNKAGLKIFDLQNITDILGKDAVDFFIGANSWLAEKLEKIKEATNNAQQEVIMDMSLHFNEKKISANITILPLINTKQKRLGSMILIEDISSEKRIKATMSRYMSPDLTEQLIKSSEASLGGTSSVATILFSDIRNFTSITEILGPEGTVHLLNEYFSQMVDCVQNEGGMLDKFIGDAIMAVFGIPFAHNDDADRAVRAAIAMMTALKAFNKKRAEKKLIQVDHGIGINTDTIVSGNIGSEKRMDYTVIGDGVNLASRVERLCKQYGAHILISEFTFKLLKATYRTRQLDKVIAKGKGKPAAIYEIIDFHDAESFPNQIEVLNHFNNGIEYYNKMQWDRAIECFEAALKFHPKDKPSKVYIERCKLLKASPPGPEWNGVWIMKHK
jgi:adenylate cyclase